MVNKITKVKLLIVVFFFTVQGSFAQYNPNPCSVDGVYCNNSAERNAIIYSFIGDTIEYAAPGTSMPFWLAVGNDSSRTIDTSFISPVMATVLYGPGLLQGEVAKNISKYSYFNYWNFSSPGIYEIEFSIAGLFKDTVAFRVAEPVDLCAKIKEGCSNGGGDIVLLSTGNGGIIPVDAIFPISAGVVNSSTGQVDSSFYGYVYLNKLSGPGNMYGTLSMYGGRWLTFTDVRFDTEGVYEVEVTTSSNHTPDTIDVHVYANSVKGLSSSGLTVFPNPFYNNITIDFDNNETIGGVSIFNTQGRLVEQYSSTSSTTFNLSHLSSGIYFLHVKTDKDLKEQIIIMVKR